MTGRADLVALAGKWDAEAKAAREAARYEYAAGREDSAEELREAASALRSSGEANAWRPIAEAPRDGRELILLLTPSRIPQVAYSNTWWTAGFSVECKPTHWMPIADLPTPPTSTKA